MKSGSKFFISLFFLQILVWTLFTFSDYMTESYNCSDTYILIIPIAIIPIYFLLRRRIYKEINFITVGLVNLYWFLLTACSGTIITILVFDDCWIVTQKKTGFLSFNGIEYPLFAMLLFLIPSIFISLTELIIFLINIYNKKFR